MSSTRLPGKVMHPINGEPMIDWQIQRILKAPEIYKVIVATSLDASDDPLADHLASKNIEFYRGSLPDVFSRFKSIIETVEDCDTFLRLTADCPLTMPNLISEMLGIFWLSNYDYYSNCKYPTFPDGLDIEIFSRNAFEKLSGFSLDERDLEHVTIKFRETEGEFFSGEFSNSVDLSSLRWTVDYPEDFTFVSSVFNNFQGKELEISMDDILNFTSSDSDSLS